MYFRKIFTTSPNLIFQTQFFNTSAKMQWNSYVKIYPFFFFNWIYSVFFFTFRATYSWGELLTKWTITQCCAGAWPLCPWNHSSGFFCSVGFHIPPHCHWTEKHFLFIGSRVRCLLAVFHLWEELKGIF